MNGVENMTHSSFVVCAASLPAVDYALRAAAISLAGALQGHPGSSIRPAFIKGTAYAPAHSRAASAYLGHWHK